MHFPVDMCKHFSLQNHLPEK